MKLKDGQKIIVYTGAGISAPSGIKTFRDQGGLWENHSIDEVCNLNTFMPNYDTVHDFYNNRRKELKSVKPNLAHELIKKMQDELGVDNVINITTNVDDFYERLGVKKTIYLHGKLREMKNLQTGEVEDLEYNSFDFSSQDKVYKPNVIFFNEIAPEYETLSSIRTFDIKDGDIILCVGMSFNVLPLFSLLPISPNVKVKIYNINKGNTDDDRFFDKNYYGCVTEQLPIFIEEILS